MRDLKAGCHRFSFGEVTHVMGVVNLSLDSRNRHTVATSPDHALAMATSYREAGASIIDLGAQSSHFENPTISPQAEIDLLLPALVALVEDDFAVSVDTWKPEVATAALAGGAALINDTGGLQNPEMRDVLRGSATVAVYLEGANPHEVGDIEINPRKVDQIASWFRSRLSMLASEGIEHVIIDPGIALNYRGDYAAYTQQQMEVIRGTATFQELGHPVLIPIPRKKEDHRVMAYITLALENGADLIRVHDVAEACDLVTLFGRLPELA